MQNPRYQLNDNNSDFELATDLNTVFLADNREAIWQLESLNSFNAKDAQFLIGLLYFQQPTSANPFFFFFNQ